MILRCHPREILGLVDEIARLRQRLAAVEAELDNAANFPGLTSAVRERLRSVVRGESKRCPPHRYPASMPAEVIAWRCVKCGEIIRD